MTLCPKKAGSPPSFGKLRFKSNTSYMLRCFRCLVIFGAGLLLANLCEAQSRRLVSYHERQAWDNLPPQSRMSGTERLDLTISLPLRNQAALTNLLQQIYDPASPNFHRYLSPAKFTELFGPTEADYEKVIRFAEANGMKVTSRHSNRMLITVNAAAADAEKTFAVKLNRYQHPTESREFYAPDVAPTVAGDVPLLEVSGLDDYVLPQPSSLQTQTQTHAANSRPQPLVGSGPGGDYMGDDFRNVYVPGVTLTGAGQSIGLLQFNGYYTNDIAAYETKTGRTNLVIQVLCDTFNGVPTNSNVETSLDIEMAMSMAPSANICVYEGNSATAILNRIATDNICKQSSSSWTFGLSTTIRQIFQEYALQGQSFSQASGDHCATVGAAYAPEDNPYLTVVGGTELTTATAGGPWQSEAVWNWNNTGSGTSGSSGGSSTFYAIPVWQQGVNMTASLGSTTMRNTPDLAMNADNNFVIAENGTNLTGIAGTSCASPLWAGFAALVNQQAAASGQPPLGFANPAIYSVGLSQNYQLCFHDITTGNNTNAASPNQYYAVPGYDLCSGWGTPTGSNLITALVNAHASALFLPNGDFEFGSFTNWTLTGSSSLNLVTTSSNYILSGAYGVLLRQNSTLGYLSQNLATVPGQSYLVSLWLENVTNGSPNEFLVSWNGTNIFDAVNSGIFAWTNLQFTVTASSTNTLFKLGFRNDSGAFGLDSVGVAAEQLPQLFRSVQNGNWNATNSWQISYDGINWTAAPNAPNNTFTAVPSPNNPVTVAVTNGVTITNSVTADHVAVYSGGTLGISAAGALNIAYGGGTDLDVFGTVNNSGTFSSGTSANAVFESGSVYQHAQNSGVLPTATWSSNSTCAITGWTTGTSVLTNMNLGQTFGNFTWNCPAQTAAVSLGNSKLATIAGNFTVASTGSGIVKIANNGSLTNNILGDLRLQAGNLNLCSGSGTVVINLSGNFAATGGTLTSTGSVFAAFNFVNSGTQFFTNLNSISSAGKINWTVNTGSTLNLGANLLVGAGSFTLQPGGGLICAHPSGLNGNLQVTGGTSLSAAGNYTFAGVSPQVTGSLLPAGINNLTVSNFAAVTLGSSLAVNGVLSLAYTNGSPPLIVTNGTLTLNNNPISIWIAGAAPLPAGNYKIVKIGADGNVSGQVVASNATVSGAGIVSGTTATAQIVNGELYLAVTSIGQPVNVQVAGGGANITFNAIPFYSYQIQRATNLTFTGGVRLWSTNAPVGGMFQVPDDFSDLGGQPPQAFYRLIYSP